MSIQEVFFGNQCTRLSHFHFFFFLTLSRVSLHHPLNTKPKVFNESVTMPAHRKTAKPIMQQGPSTAQKQIAKKRGEAF
jgi:hypothetical protein